ncbi:MAG: hypothetical protein HY273_01530 [Gammaproteobacteria bacterium]|nr:hypothetical protein [Gammaproteobacteria bacterium]
MKRLLISAVGLALNIPVMAADVDYRKDVRALWQAKCSACHGADAPYVGDFKEAKEKFTAAMKGPRMDTYSDLLYFVAWPDTGALMRRLDTSAKTS